MRKVSMPLSQQDTLEDRNVNGIKVERQVSMPLSQQDTLEDKDNRMSKQRLSSVSMPLSQQDTLEASKWVVQ